MSKRATLTAEQIAYIARHFRKGVPGQGIAAIARALGLPDHFLRRHLDQEYRHRRNAASLAWHHANAKSRARPKPTITLPELRLPA